MGDIYISHHGVKGMKWGVRKDKKPKLSYEQKVKKNMEDYHQSHKGRSKKDNYTIALRKESRDVADKTTKRMGLSFLPFAGTIVAGMAGAPVASVAGAAWAISAGSAAVTAYIANNKQKKLADLYDEYNIERSERIVNL